MRLKFIAFTVLILAFSQLAFGTTVLVPANYGFDERITWVRNCTAPICVPVQEWNDVSLGDGNPPHWTVVGVGGDYKSLFGMLNGAPGFIDPLSAPNVGWLRPGAYLYQTLPVNLVIGEEYIFGYFVGRRAEISGTAYRLVVTTGTTGPFTEGVNMWTKSGNTTGIPGYPNMYGWMWDQVAFKPDAASAAFAG